MGWMKGFCPTLSPVFKYQVVQYGYIKIIQSDGFKQALQESEITRNSLPRSFFKDLHVDLAQPESN